MSDVVKRTRPRKNRTCKDSFSQSARSRETDARRDTHSQALHHLAYRVVDCQSKSTTIEINHVRSLSNYFSQLVTDRCAPPKHVFHPINHEGKEKNRVVQVDR
jgi:hypothetical protein